MSRDDNNLLFLRLQNVTKYCVTLPQKINNFKLQEVHSVNL